MGSKPEWWRRFWIEAATVLVTMSVLDIALPLFNILDLNGLAQGVMWMFTVLFAVYGLQHIMLDVLSDKAVLRASKIGYTLLGVCVGIPVGLILFSPPILGTTSEHWLWLLLTFGVAPPIGGLVTYSIGKRRGFRTQITRWRETHRSIEEEAGLDTNEGRDMEEPPSRGEGLRKKPREWLLFLLLLVLWFTVFYLIPHCLGWMNMERYTPTPAQPL